MSAVLSRSDFDFSDLKQRTATVFLVLPPDRLGSYWGLRCTPFKVSE